MVSSTGDEAKKASPITVSTVAVVPEPGDTYHPDMNHGNSTPSTPTTAHTVHKFDIDDIEAMKPARSQETLRGSSRFQSDGRVWPGQAFWREKTRAAKRKNRTCQCLARLDKRTQVVIKITIVLLILGIAVAVGFAVSKSLGARIWKPQDDQI
ncbi:hypothetical protein F5Y08DRAFT_237467 [Xylaria arbuscula]|uniref:Uncharacterized protein n=1 Tax=Xylaria arbuscula TaxID=114810 RepID=A0A9W8NCY4_9PEZI|nr:hypothetical protein F5Y08DRAFT_237467 [Xylaria arbuscula]KAJ3568999.1 hypothetical protein NPX13_g6230 [Xylaria arbuscula]